MNSTLRFFGQFTFGALLIASLLATGCSSSKKKNAMAEGGAAGSDSYELELNGDSDSGKAGALRTVYFDFNSSQLSDTARTTLENNAQFLKQNTSVEVQVEGHADERGGIQYNLALGERRASAVRNYLVAMGVDRKRISTISYGKERPLSFGHDEDAWSKNRRGNFVITAK